MAKSADKYKGKEAVWFTMDATVRLRRVVIEIGEILTVHSFPSFLSY